MGNKNLAFLTSCFKQVLICLMLIMVYGCGSDAGGDDSTKLEDSICGGLLGKKCALENQFCKFAEGVCGQGDQTGTCAEKPDFCAEIYSPVCGCDNKTYGNECNAFGAGISVKSQGECK